MAEVTTIENMQPIMVKGLNLPPIFEAIVSDTVTWETSGRKDGAYTNDPKDAGGETKWGISKRANPDVNIKDLTYKEAIKIYYTKYWDPMYILIPDDKLMFKIFDMGVLNGKMTAVRYLQECIKKYKTIKVDGVFGPITATALSAATIEGHNQDIYDAYVQKFLSRVTRIILVKPWNLKFKKGWINRINYVFPPRPSYPIDAARVAEPKAMTPVAKPVEKVEKVKKTVAKKAVKK